ncbi:MAG: PA2779 family protein [bacterium]|nr:PA2779 family protein [bacterium]
MSLFWYLHRGLVGRFLRSGTISLLALSMIVLGPVTMSARAGMVSTESVLEAESLDARARIHELVDRERVRSELEALGVEHAEAHARIDALSDLELAAVAGQLDRLPAGGGGLGSVLLAGVVIFIVLIVTDSFGVTDLFPWVHKYELQ